MEDNGLATELLHEVKLSARRWFLVAMAELIAIVILIIIFFFVPTEEASVTVENEDGNASYVGRDLNGGLYYGEGDSEVQETQGSRSETQAP